MKELLNKYNIEVKNIKYINNIKILNTNKGLYKVLNKNNNHYKLYKYLKEINFNNYLNPITNKEDKYEIYKYKEEKDLDKETKIKELINIISNLHNKTIRYIDINIDNINKIYEDNINKINDILKYYYDLQDEIENHIYMAPGEYLLIRNINLIYICLNEARFHLDNWYEIIKKINKKKEVLLNNNISTNNILISDNNYIIDWDKSSYGDVSNDLISLIKNEYKYLDINNIYELYQSKYKYIDYEKELFFYNIKLPWIINFNKSNYINTVNVNDLLLYLKKVSNLSLKEYKENKETKQEEFN